jgi:hypothetical protein
MRLADGGASAARGLPPGRLVELRGVLAVGNLAPIGQAEATVVLAQQFCLFAGAARGPTGGLRADRGVVVQTIEHHVFMLS